MPRKTTARRWRSTCSARFNEAAARCRGKLVFGRRQPRPDLLSASMRPRPDAAENLLEGNDRLALERTLQ